MAKKFRYFFLLFFLTLIFTYPAIFHLTDRIIGDGGDNYEYVAFQYLGYRQLISGQFPFGWTNLMRYPVGFDFSTSYDCPLLIFIGYILYPVISNPVAVYNLSVLILLFLNQVLSFLFFKKISKDPFLGFTGSIIYGFSFYTLARLGGHTNLLVSSCFPFFLYGAIRLKEHKGEPKSFAIFTFAVILLFLTSLQYLLIFLGSLLLVLPVLILFYPALVKEYLAIVTERKKYALLSILVIIFAFLIFHGGRVEAVFTGNLILPSSETVNVPPVNYLLPNGYLRIPTIIFSNTSEVWIENAVYLGLAEMILFLSFILFKTIAKKEKLFITGLVSVFLIVSMGSGKIGLFNLPYAFLFKFMPFRGIIEPGRFYVIFYLFIALGIVFYLKKFFRETGKLGMILVISLLIYERLPVNFYLSPTHRDENFISYAAGGNSRAVLDLPVFTDWWNGNVYDLYEVYYQKPIVNGYIHWSGDTAENQIFLKKLNKFNCVRGRVEPVLQFTAEIMHKEDDENRELLSDFKTYGINTFVVHKDLSYQYPECREVIKRAEILFKSKYAIFRKVFEDEKKIVYQM